MREAADATPVAAATRYSGVYFAPYGRSDRIKLAMSAIGTKRTCASAPHMSAFGGKADMASALQNVRL